MKKEKITEYILCLTLLFAVLSGHTQAQADTAMTADIDINMIRIQSEAVVLIDGDTGQVLFEKNMHAKMYPASITKIMTALTALENGNMSDTITMSHDAVFSVGRDTSHIALDENERLTLEQALYAAAIASANDACNGIAELIGGSMENFAELMTAKAKELGASNTNFNNTHGLPDPNHYTTPYDMARIMAAAIKIPEFVKIFSTMTYEMPPTNIQPETRYFHRVNSLLKEPDRYDGIIAEKTGWTGDAGYTYAAAAMRGGRTLIAVVMKSPDMSARWADTTALFDYGFNEFTPVSYTAEEIAKEHYIFKDADETNADMRLVPTGGFNCLISKSLNKNDIDITYTFAADNTDGKMGGKAVFSLKSGTKSFMFTNLGKVDLEIYFNDFIADENNKKEIPANSSISLGNGEQPDTESGNPIFSAIYKIYKVISVILQILGFLSVILLFLYIRRYMIIQKRKRNRNISRNINPNINTNVNRRR